MIVSSKELRIPRASVFLKWTDISTLFLLPEFKGALVSDGPASGPALLCMYLLTIIESLWHTYTAYIALSKIKVLLLLCTYIWVFSLGLELSSNFYLKFTFTYLLDSKLESKILLMAVKRPSKCVHRTRKIALKARDPSFLLPRSCQIKKWYIAKMTAASASQLLYQPSNK